MLNIDPSTRVFLCSQLIDMRFSFDALSGLVTTHFGMNPLGGHVFVFFSRRRDRMKILIWDMDGFVLYYKRLEHGTYSWILDPERVNDIETDFLFEFSILFCVVFADLAPLRVPPKALRAFRYSGDTHGQGLK